MFLNTLAGAPARIARIFERTLAAVLHATLFLLSASMAPPIVFIRAAYKPLFVLILVSPRILFHSTLALLVSPITILSWSTLGDILTLVSIATSSVLRPIIWERDTLSSSQTHHHNSHLD